MKQGTLLSINRQKLDQYDRRMDTLYSQPPTVVAIVVKKLPHNMCEVLILDELKVTLTTQSLDWFNVLYEVE